MAVGTKELKSEDKNFVNKHPVFPRGLLKCLFIAAFTEIITVF